jgi:hypothetical protein
MREFVVVAASKFSAAVKSPLPEMYQGDRGGKFQSRYLSRQ